MAVCKIGRQGVNTQKGGSINGLIHLLFSLDRYVSENDSLGECMTTEE
jgi:hypothetical protein